MECSKCGTEVPDNFNFCVGCGTPMAETTPVGAPVEPIEQTSMSDRKVSDMIKWEYKSVTTEVEGNRPIRMRDLDPAYNESTVEWLNTLGNDGWELVSITPLNIGMGRTSGLAYLVFKRPLT
jgi:hypothetical protein